jgi:hypothetical protein
MLLLSAAFTAPFTPGCDPVIVHVATNPEASFDRYQTFSFGAVEAPPAGFTVSPWSAEVGERVPPLIAAALEDRVTARLSLRGA